MEIIPYTRESFDALRRLDGLLALAMEFHGEFSPARAFFAMEDGMIKAFAALSYPLAPADGHPLRCDLMMAPHPAPCEALGPLLRAIRGSYAALLAQSPEHAAYISCYVPEGETEAARTFEAAGYLAAARIAVMERDLSLPFPNGGQTEWDIRPYPFTPATAEQYLQSEAQASGQAAQSLHDLWFKQADPSFCCYGAYIDGVLAGCISIWDIDDASGATENLFVLPGYRRQGIAQALTAHACAALSARGRGGAMLSVREDNAPAMALYRACGYVAMRGIIEYCYGKEGTHG